ncbi:phage head maturation protease [Cytobacillus horneckiae]|uniref:HK97 family phage prohead protease n=1 Tax=Cytobacillus horneckiae TaxID=549687 RepID=UPI0019CF84E2|nr:HK97 family phage prohead protease [Cytobacillus horneckiae]MBN6890037.1 HK97 family phage prohead protease [Cytobacillus horneckiae]
MEKAIYGLAMPFNDGYCEYNQLTNTFSFDKTNKDSVIFDTIVGATINHDYSQCLGDIRDNLIVKANEYGVCFKLTPNCPLGYSAYKRVKRGALRHCSVSYMVRESNKDEQVGKKAEALFRNVGWDERVIVNEYKQILLFEVCLTNNPANDITFCTIDPNHPLLKGVEWK